MASNRRTIVSGLAAWAAISALLAGGLDLLVRRAAPRGTEGQADAAALGTGTLRAEPLAVVLVGDIPVGDAALVCQAVESIFGFPTKRRGPEAAPPGTLDPRTGRMDPVAFLVALTDGMPLECVRVLGVTSFDFDGDPAPLGISQSEGKAAAVSLYRPGRALSQAIRAGGDPVREAARFRRRVFELVCRELGRTFLPRKPESPCAGDGCLASDPDFLSPRTSTGRTDRSPEFGLEDLDRADPFFCAACREELRRAVRGPVNTPVTYYHLGLYFERRRLRDRAAEAYERALALDPGMPQALNNLGAVRMRAGDLERAEAALRKAVEAKPDYALAHLNLGRVLARRGRPAEALQGFETCLRLDPSLTAAWKDGGTVLRDSLSDPARAREWFARFLEAGGQDAGVRRWLEGEGAKKD